MTLLQIWKQLLKNSWTTSIVIKFKEECCMQKTITTLTELKLVGITTRTNNAKIFEKDPSTNKIAATIQKYFHNGLAKRINDRKNPGTTLCLYALRK